MVSLCGDVESGPRTLRRLVHLACAFSMFLSVVFAQEVGTVFTSGSSPSENGTSIPSIAIGPVHSTPAPSRPNELDGRQRKRKRHRFVRSVSPTRAVEPPSDPPTEPIQRNPNTRSAAPTDFIFQTTHQFTASETGLSTSATGESSLGSMVNNTIFYAANWFAALSTNGGASFGYVSPYDTFPSVNGGFCCDQSVQYAPAQQMMIWALLYAPDNTSGTVRIATAVGNGNLTLNLWNYHDFNPQLFGFGAGNYFDFPNLSVGSTYLYVTADVYASRNDSFTGSVIWRIPLDQVASGGSISFTDYTSTTLGGWRCSEGATSTMYCGSTDLGGSSVRIIHWDDFASNLLFDDVQLAGFTDMADGGTAFSPDGTNWAADADSRVLASWVSGGVIGLMFSAQEDATHPYPYTIVARFDQSSRHLLSESQIWSASYAWLYPSVSVNASGNLAGIIAFGGGQTYPNEAVWISDDVQSGFSPIHVYTATAGTNGPTDNRWGDFFSTRRNASYPNTWVAGAYDLRNGGGDSNVVQSFLWFGRARDFVLLGLPAPVLVSPSNGSTGVPVTTGLIWNVVNGSSGYTVYLGTSNPPTAGVFSSGAPFTPAPALKAGTTYYWQVASRDPNNNNAESPSQVWSFTTAVPAGNSGVTLFLQNQANLGVSAWLMGGMNNSIIQSSPWFATAASGWALVATADMNGDGVPDLIFQNRSTGGVSIWFMIGPSGLTIGSAPIIYTAAPNWQLATAADLNGDGVPDLIFENSITNQISIWFMQAGGMNFSSAPIIATAVSGWRLVATGDMNQDGVPDLLFQNQTSGQISIWFMRSGGLAYSSAPIVASPAAGWTLAGTRDFNGDGVPDYVFQNRSTGQVSVWYMAGTQGTSYSSAPVIATAAPGWSLFAAH